MFGDELIKLANSIVIAITKTNPEEISFNDIKGILLDISESRQRSNPEVEIILRHLIAKERIFLVPIPSAIDHKLIKKLTKTIEVDVPAVTLSNNASLELSS